MAKRTKQLAPAPAPAEISSDDRAALTDAFKAGLIVSWKLDADRGYRLTRTGRADEYVHVAHLGSHLERLREGR